MKQTRAAVLLFGQETSHRMQRGDDDDQRVVLIWSSGRLGWSSKNDPGRALQQLVVVGDAYRSDTRRSNNMRCWVGLCNNVRETDVWRRRNKREFWNMFYFLFFQISPPSGENERVTAVVKCKFQKEDAFVAASCSRLHRRNSTYMHRCTYADTTWVVFCFFLGFEFDT